MMPRMWFRTAAADARQGNEFLLTTIETFQHTSLAVQDVDAVLCVYRDARRSLQSAEAALRINQRADGTR